MDRSFVRVTVLGALLISVVWGTGAAAKSRFIRRISAAKPRATAPLPPSEAIHWQHDLRTAQRFSAATGRPMLVVFGAPWCTYCKKLEAETLGHPSLASYINTEFVPVHLDFDKDRRAAQILEVQSLPHCVILSAQADLLGSVEGYVRPPEFTKALHQAVNYQRTLEAESAIADR
jgi:thioredoxin-related protein